MAATRTKDFPDLLLEHGVIPCAVAGAFVLVAFLWTFPLQHLFAYPFLFLFLGAVMGSAWFGGRIAGLISVVLSTAIIDFFFVPPFYSFHVNGVAQTYWVAFIVCAIAMSWVSSTRKRSENAIRDARDQLEQRVMERTADLELSNAEIQESERRLRTLTEAIPQQIWSAGLDGRIDYCNNHLLEYAGYGLEDLKGEGFLRILHPEDAELFRELWDGFGERMGITAGSSFEACHRRLWMDGRIAGTELTLILKNAAAPSRPWRRRRLSSRISRTGSAWGSLPLPLPMSSINH
jgi:PAS domain-containing protein